MKNKTIVLFSMFLILLLVNRYLVYGSVSEKTYKIDEGIVYNLLENRTYIMNKGLFSNEDMNGIIMKLNSIERAKLLKEDIMYLKEARTNPTDYPFVTGFEIVRLDLLTTNNNVCQYKVLIKWNIYDNTQESSDNIEYFIEIQQKEGRFFLTSLETVE